MGHDRLRGRRSGQDRLVGEMIEEVKAWVSNAGLWEIEAKGVPPKRMSVGILLSQDGIF